MSESAQIGFGAPPEYYTDALRLGSTPYGFVFQFGLAADSPGESQTQAVVRMSPQHALVLYQVLKKNLRHYESQIGKIDLPDALYAELGIEKEV